MSKSRIADEVQVYRFFDEAPVEKAETVFKLVAERMRARIAPTGGVRPTPKRPIQATPRTAPSEGGA